MIATTLRTCLSIALGLSSLAYAPSVSALSEYIAAPNSTDATAINDTNQATFAPPLAQSKLNTTPTINGVITVNEYGSHINGQNQQTNSSQVAYMTWDATNLYLAYSNANINEGVVIYIDKDPIVPANGGSNLNGNLGGQAYDGTNFASLPFRADFVAYIKNGYREYRTANGVGGWSSATSGFGSYVDNGGTNVREVAIPWSALGGQPSAFNFFAYVTSSGGFVYGQLPGSNAGGSIGTSASYSNYYLVANTAAPSYPFAAVSTAGVCYATPNDGTTVFSSADAQAVRNAIAAASSNGTVKVAGYCAGVSSGNVVTINKALTLTGGYTSTDWSTYSPSASPTTLDAQGAGRVISITGAVATTIQGLTVTNGFVSSPLNGAGINTDGPISIIESYIFSNTASDGNGGGGYFGSSANVTGTTFVSNTANGNSIGNDSLGGGGYFVGSANVTGTTFMSNTAALHGGGGHFGGSTHVTGTIFMSNTASQYGGGGIFNGSAHVTGTTFVSNTALYSGGGGFFVDSANVTGTTFMSNTALTGGGSFFGSVANVADTTFIGNIALSLGNGGGGVSFNFSGARTFINVLFANNRATKHGAALYVQQADPLNLIHVTIVSQTMPTGATDAIYVSGGTVNLTNTLIATHTVGILRVGGTVSENYTLFSGVSTPYSGTITAGATSITGTAAFFDTTNYTLTASSRAIDNGVNAGISDDYFGAARPQGNGFDIGYAESPFAAYSDLGITKTTVASSVNSGATLTYTVIVSNNGAALASNVVLTDAMPAGVSFVSGSVITPGGTGTCAATGCNLGDLAAGAYATATFTVTAPSTAGVITNTAGVTASNDSVTSNNFASVTTTIAAGVCSATPNDGMTVFSSANAQAVRDAIAAASSGGTVKVAGYCAGVATQSGTTQVVLITQTVTVAGGYTTSNWLAYNPIVNVTTLDAEKSGRVISTSNVAITLQGFRVISGFINSKDGGGIYSSDTITLVEMTLLGNEGGAFGGGLYASKDAVVISSTLAQNSTGTAGGGAYFAQNATIINTYVITNTSDESGGGLTVEDSIYMSNSFVNGNIHGGADIFGGGTINNSVFRANQNGALRIESSMPITIFNNLFANNLAEPNGIVSLSSPTYFIHNTIVSDTIDVLAIGIENESVYLTNTLIANYATGIQLNGGTVSENYTLFDGVTTPRSGTIIAGARSITGTAAFFDTINYTLTASSYAIDNGIDAGIASDYFGVARPQGGGVDIGYAESPFTAYPNLGITKTASASSVATNASLSYTILISNTSNTWANSAVLSDAMPAGVTFGSGSIITPTGSATCAATGCNLGNLMPGGYATATFTITAPSSAGVITNTAGITVSNDSNASNNFASVATTIAAGVCSATHNDGTTVFSSADAQAVRDAIAAASSGGTVKVAGYCAGVISGNVITISKALTLTGGYTTSNWSTYNLAANPTTLDAQGAGRVISITGAVATTIQGLTVTGGLISTGTGAGMNTTGPITISESSIFNNKNITGTHGGGVYASSGVVIIASNFYSNAVGSGAGSLNSSGGAAYVSGSAVISASNFYSNTASGDNSPGNGNGGAVYVSGNAVISASNFYSNAASGEGGGAYVVSNAVISASNFYSNTADFDNSFNGNGGGAYVGNNAVINASNFYSNNGSIGGGVFIASSAVITGSNFYSNTVTNSGGGARLEGTTSITASNFYSNVAVFGGGPAAWIQASAAITGSKFYNNAGNFGGGIFFSASAGTGQIVNSLFANNVGTNVNRGAALHVGNAASFSFINNTVVAPSFIMSSAITVDAGTVGLTNTLISNYATGIQRINGTVSEDYTLFSGVTTPRVGTITAGANSIIGTAAFFDTTNYTLTASSRAIDMGTNAGVTVDYFGNARPQGNGFDVGYAESPFTAYSDLGITKTTAASSVNSGATLTYTIRISNNGMLLAPNVVLTDAMPAGVTFGSGSVITPGGSGTCAATGCNLGNLAAGGYATATFTVTAPSTAGVITNTAGVSASNDSTTSNNFAAVTTTIAAGGCSATHNDGTTVFSSNNAQAVRDAIAAASSGGTVKVAGYCAGVSGGNVITITKDLTLTGGYTNTDWATYSPAANPTTLDAQAAGRVISITGGVAVTVQGLTVTNGYINFGIGNNRFGAGINSNGDMIISDTYVFSNVVGTGAWGGGVYIGGNAVVSGSNFYSNTASTAGGGIYISGTSVISGSNFYRNAAVGSLGSQGFGGGAYMNSRLHSD